MWRRKRWKRKSTEEVTLSKRTVSAERERERQRERCYDLLSTSRDCVTTSLRHLFMGWAVLSFIITSFCGLSSNLYHKPNCKSYFVSFSFSSKKKKPNLYILELDQPHSRHCYTRSKQNQWNWENKAFEFFQVRYSSLKYHFFLVEYFFSKTTQV